MTSFILTHKIDAPSVQKATALRDRLASDLDAEDEVKVIHSGMSQETRRFKVIGVDVAGKTPFAEDVEAPDEEAAIKKVASTTRIVAEVRPT